MARACALAAPCGIVAVESADGGWPVLLRELSRRAFPPGRRLGSIPAK